MKKDSIMAEHAKAKAQKKKSTTVKAAPNEMTRIRDVLDGNGGLIKRTVKEPKV